MECTSAFMEIPETVYTSLSYLALFSDWLITLTLTLINCDNIILEQNAGSQSGVYVDYYGDSPDSVDFTFVTGTFV